MFSGANVGRTSSRSSTHGEKLKAVDRAGLVNPSNTCYMNSTLQCLATLDSVHTLLSQADSSAPHASAPFSSPSLQALLHEKYPAGLPVTAALASTLRKLWSQKGGTINAKELLKTVGKRNETYADIHEQQDVQEACSFLTSCLWEEETDLIKKARPAPPQSSRPDRKPHRRRKAMDPNDDPNRSSDGNSSDSETSSDSSSAGRLLLRSPEISPNPSSAPVLRPFVDTLFGGKLASIIVCEVCKNVSIAREPFQDLSVEMEKDEKPRRRDRIRSFLSKNTDPVSPATPVNKGPAMMARQSSQFGSVSEAEASASEDEDPETATGTMDAKKTSDLSRRRSLDPAILRSKRSIFSTLSREPSPQRRPTKVHSTSKGPSIPRPSPEQTAYIKRLLAEIPGAAVTPLSNLRIAQPDGKPRVIGPGSDYGAPKKKEKDEHHHHFHIPHHSNHVPSLSDAQVLEEQMSTGLYEALRRFTAVEILEGENAFQCNHCWKCLNPKLERLRRKRRQSTMKSAQTIVPNENKLLVEQDALDDDEERDGTRPLLMSTNVTAIGADATLSKPFSMMSSMTRAASGSSDSSVYSINPRGSVNTSTSVASDQRAQSDLLDSKTDSSFLSMSESDVGSMDEQSSAPTSEVPDAGSGLARNDSLALSTMSANSAPTVMEELSQVSLVEPPSLKIEIIPPKAQRYILRRAHKRLLIDSLPRVLIVHLKRFQQSSRTAMFGSGTFRDLKKIDTFVSFPLELDLSPFLAPRDKPPDGKRRGVTDVLRPTLRPANSDSSNHHAWFHWHHQASGLKSSAASSRYRLVGIISHSGSMSSGHYVAYVLATNKHGERQWIYASDETIRAVTVDEVKACKAYNLWYEME